MYEHGYGSGAIWSLGTESVFWGRPQNTPPLLRRLFVRQRLKSLQEVVAVWQETRLRKSLTYAESLLCRFEFFLQYALALCFAFCCCSFCCGGSCRCWLWLLAVPVFRYDVKGRWWQLGPEQSKVPAVSWKNERVREAGDRLHSRLLYQQERTNPRTEQSNPFSLVFLHTAWLITLCFSETEKSPLRRLTARQEVLNWRNWKSSMCVFAIGPLSLYSTVTEACQDIGRREEEGHVRAYTGKSAYLLPFLLSQSRMLFQVGRIDT